VFGSDLHEFIVKAINQGKVLVVGLYLESTKMQNLIQVIMKKNTSHKVEEVDKLISEHEWKIKQI
jgi:hypothetical protein